MSEFSARVVAVVPRGEVIRNFVYTGAFDRIAERAQLTLLTVAPNDETVEMLRQRYASVLPLENQRERWIVNIQRDLIDQTHNRWIWSEAARERSRLRDAEAVTFRKKSLRTVKKAFCRPFANRAGLDFLGKIERATSRWLRTTDDYLKFFQETKPTLVFNGSHIHSHNAVQAVQAAQWLGIPTATFIFSWDNLTSQGRIILPYDYFLVWNETLRRQLLEMYRRIAPENVFVTGTPQFDFHFQPKYEKSKLEFCRSINADPARPLVLYSTGMANHMPDEQIIVEQIADVLQDLQEFNRPQLVVRVYPKDLTDRFDELKKRRKDILFPAAAWETAWLTPKDEDSYQLTNILRHCDVGINVASTVSLELCMFDKPVVNVGYNPPNVAESDLSYANYYNFDHYRPIVESRAVQVARSPEEMRRLLVEALREPQKYSRERAALIEKMFGATLDGKSSARIADALLKVAAAPR